LPPDEEVALIKAWDFPEVDVRRTPVESEPATVRVHLVLEAPTPIVALFLVPRELTWRRDIDSRIRRLADTHLARLLSERGWRTRYAGLEPLGARPKNGVLTVDYSEKVVGRYVPERGGNPLLWGVYPNALEASLTLRLTDFASPTTVWKANLNARSSDRIQGRQLADGVLLAEVRSDLFGNLEREFARLTW